MIDKNKLRHELTTSFINYQWRLENPMPTMLEDDDRLTEHYMSDWLFHNRVDSIVSHVMQIIISNEEFS